MLQKQQESCYKIVCSIANQRQVSFPTQFGNNKKYTQKQAKQTELKALLSGVTSSLRGPPNTVPGIPRHVY